MLELTAGLIPLKPTPRPGRGPKAPNPKVPAIEMLVPKPLVFIMRFRGDGLGILAGGSQSWGGFWLSSQRKRLSHPI